MAATHLTESRAVPAPRDEAYDRVLSTPLPEIFHRRYALMPPIREVREAPDSWDTVGQSRRIVTTDGGTMLEELTAVERPQSWGYTLSEVTGPLKPLVSTVDGLWTLEDAGTGCRIAWTWTVHPRGRAGALAMPLLGRLWHGYARQALEEIERLLLR
jgi:Polyketide cyclase / dehydrase and lipid transport